MIAILNTAGTAVVQYTYDAWGNILTTTGTMASTLGKVNPLTYRGYVYDTETGLYYLQSRYYDPEIGRFLNADAFASTGQGILGNNMFAYCGNNPVNGYDPTGHLRFDVTTCSVDGGNWGRRHAASLDSIYFKTEGVINGQKIFEFSQVAFGLGTYANNGCGAIAVYNALQLLGRNVSLGMISDQIIHENGMCLGGLLGVLPWVIDNVIEENGISCTGYSSYHSLAQDVQEGSVIIFMVANNVDTILGGAHYMAAQYVGGEYVVYNMYGSSSKAERVSSLFQPYGNSGYLYGFIIGG